MIAAKNFSLSDEIGEDVLHAVSKCFSAPNENRTNFAAERARKIEIHIEIFSAKIWQYTSIYNPVNKNAINS